MYSQGVFHLRALSDHGLFFEPPGELLLRLSLDRLFREWMFGRGSDLSRALGIFFL